MVHVMFFPSVLTTDDLKLLPVLNVLYFYISTFRSLYAVPSMAVFGSTLISYFPGMVLGTECEMVPVARIINGVTLFLHSTCAVFLL
jgi:hypothetical protein